MSGTSLKPDDLGRGIADALPVGISVAHAPSGEFLYANQMFVHGDRASDYRIHRRATFEALRRIDPDVRAVLMTGHAVNEDAQAILDLGVRAFFEKQFGLRAVAAKLSELARERGLVRDAH